MEHESANEATVERLVHQFYARVREDALLGPVFEAKLAGKWERHLPRMVAFWSKLLLERGEFHGNVFGKHMALQDIQRVHFARWMSLFVETAREVLEPALALKAERVAERIASTLQAGYFGGQREWRSGALARIEEPLSNGA